MKNKIAYLGCLSLIGMITTEFGVIGILPQLALHYGVSMDRAGLLLSAYALVVALAGPWMTVFTSGVNRKTLMAIAMAVFLLTGIVSSMTPPFWLLMLVRVLPAFLHPVLVATAVAAATATGGQQYGHRMMAIVMGGIGIAMISTVPLSTYLAGYFNQWQASFMLQAFISLSVLILILLLMPAMPVGEKKSYRAQLLVLRNPAFLMTALCSFLMIAGIFSSYSYFADYLGRVNGMTESTISLMLLLFGLSGLAGNFVAGKLLSKSIVQTTVWFLAGLMVVSVLLYFSGAMPVFSTILILIWGFLQTPCFLTAQAYMISKAPEAQEFANSLAISSGNLGISAGAFAGGLAIVHTGVQSTLWVMFGFTATALLVILIEQRSLKK
jgi:predicted MFS family arabinose efflux permease